MRITLLVLCLAAAFSNIISVYASSNQSTHPRQEVKGMKTKNYIGEGFFAFGDRAVTAVKLRDIRRAFSKEGYERIVFDLEPLTTLEKNAPSMPYFQVQNSPHEKRIVLSIWSDVNYSYNADHIQKLFTKSNLVEKMNIVPRVEEGLSIIELLLKPSKREAKLEVFYLSQPTRIILDIL